MAKRMLIDATHPEETRVVVLSGNRLEEFDFESSTKRHVKGNIYLAKVTRVEPSLQAAFVDYGGNRHGFLAFSEIHPDYYKIPVGDREPIDPEAAHEEADTPQAPPENGEGAGVSLAAALPEPVPVPAPPEIGDNDAGESALSEPSGFEASEPAPPAARLEEEAGPAENTGSAPDSEESRRPEMPPAQGWPQFGSEAQTAAEHAEPGLDIAASAAPGSPALPDEDETKASTGAAAASSDWDETIASTEAAALSPDLDAPIVREANKTAPDGNAEPDEEAGEVEAVETLGGDELEDAERLRSPTIRHYKIQEVIKRRQIMLVQVTKEERGNKGAALTTYLSLAGRYCVLMPNTARGGGVSRKITNLADRRRLKDFLEELDIPEGMGVIVRTAGAERSKAEIKRDYEYLLRLWNEVRDLTLRSTAPALIYEEANLIKRSIRDLYMRDIDEVLVEGEEGYRTAKAFMKMLMPSHAKRVQPYRDSHIALFHRFQVESQIDAIHSPVVQLRSGGYVVINQTEALVAIDVNSGRSTRERNIEETAVRTNLEAAEEIARQLRLRDLAGLIVIDFIDMEERRNQVAVERRVKEALKSDRARIQVGRISAFGLLEMSRQRLRPSLVETSTQPCPHCGGTGSIRSTESTALYVLRCIEEEGMRRRSAEICVYVPTAVALYILNQKRDSLVHLEARYGVRVLVARDDALVPPAFRLERLRALTSLEAAGLPSEPLSQTPATEDDDEDIEEVLEAADAAPDGEEERVRSRRRRRRRRRHDEESRPSVASAVDLEQEDEGAERAAANGRADGNRHDGDEDADTEPRRRRRGRRGGRRRPRREAGGEPEFEGTRPASDTVEILPVHEFEEAEPPPVQAPENVPAEVNVVAVETASLPALAGDPAEAPRSEFSSTTPEEPAEQPSGSGEPELPDNPPLGEQTPPAEPIRRAAPPTAEVAGDPAEAPRSEFSSTTPEPAEQPSGSGEPELPDNPPLGEQTPPVEPSRPAAPPTAEVAGDPAEAPRSEFSSTTPEPTEQPSGGREPELPDNPSLGEQTPPVEPIRPAAPPTAEAEQGVPYVGDGERVLETVSTESEAKDESEPAHAVETVSEKPANPRRGWWQRLIPS